MAGEERPYQPPWTARATSSMTIGMVGLLCRSFLFAFNRTETQGLDNFLRILDRRREPENRQRGLITVANHVSVMDDPTIWGVLPFRYHWDPTNMRYSLGSYDILFNKGGKPLANFFYYGNTLPTHRSAHSQPGGLFQPTMREAIRLLSDPHKTFQQSSDLQTTSFPTTDPFASSELTYTTNGSDVIPAPSAYPSRRHSWVHVFPEGKIHQHPDKYIRYFKWGVARLILESDPCPDVLPIWIDGMQGVMDENRGWPRPLPRPNNDIKIYFGDLADRKPFEKLRERWQQLKAKASKDSTLAANDQLGELTDEYLRTSPEAQQLRIDVTMAVRNEVLKLRRSTGLSDEDPKAGLAETWRAEGGKSQGKMKDSSIVRDV